MNIQITCHSVTKSGSTIETDIPAVHFGISFSIVDRPTDRTRLGAPPKSTVNSTYPVYQTDRQNHTPLQSDRPNARVGLVGLLTILSLL